MINRLKGGYSILPNEIFKLGLSLKAIGLYSYMNSKTTLEDWNFSYKGLMSELVEGEKALRNAIKELKSVNLLVTIPKKLGKEFKGHEWILNPNNEDLLRSVGGSMELAIMEAPKTEAPKTEAPETASALINTEKPITEKINTEGVKEVPSPISSFSSERDLLLRDISHFLDMKKFLVLNNKTYPGNKQYIFDYENNQVSISDKGLPYFRKSGKNLTFEQSDNFYKYLSLNPDKTLSTMEQQDKENK